MKTEIAYCLIITLLNYAFCCVASIRQYRKLNDNITSSASKLYTKEQFSTSCKYNKDKLLFKLFKEFLDLIQTILIVLFIEQIYSAFTKRILKNDIVFTIVSMVINIMLGLPLNFYFDFVIEQRHGFNKKTIGVFIKDIFLGLGLTIGICSPLFVVLKYIITTYKNFPLYFTVFMTVFRVFLIIIYPNFITPLYNKVTPLENTELKQKVEKLAKKVGFTIDRIEVIDGSKRSGHSNAYFIGIGKAKRIVFFDTILAQLSDDEILAVLCHELGHWNHCHVLLNSFVSSFNVLMYCFLLQMYYKNTLKFFEFDGTFVIFTTLCAGLDIPLTLLLNHISRVFERQADRFAVKHGYGDHLISGLSKMTTENKSAPVVDSLFSAMNYSHPHTTERIEAIEYEMEKSE